jgi:hypothetical protein
LQTAWLVAGRSSSSWIACVIIGTIVTNRTRSARDRGNGLRSRFLKTNQKKRGGARAVLLAPHAVRSPKPSPPLVLQIEVLSSPIARSRAWSWAVGSSAPTGGPPHGKRAALTGVSSDQNLLDMSIANAVRGLRGPKYENWPLGDPRPARCSAVAPGVLLQIECLRKTRGTQAFRGCPGRRGRDG